jgi:chemotaxis protein CheD
MPQELNHQLRVSSNSKAGMNAHQPIIRVDPGEFYISQADELIYTRLGSCVAACIWDPIAGVGGLNHFLVPEKRSQNEWKQLTSFSCRYGNWAMEQLINAILSKGGNRKRLQAKVFGGAQMTPHISIQIGQANIDFVRHYLGLENIPIVSEDMGGILPRKVLFHPLSGKALMKSLPMSIVSKVNHQEQDYLQALDKDDQRSQNDIELF